MENLTKQCHANDKEIKNQYDYMKMLVDNDIGQIVSRCQQIENKLENLPREMESEDVLLRKND